MKNNKKKVILLLAIAALILGCQMKGCGEKSRERAEKRNEKRALENFQNYILGTANAEVQRGMGKTADFEQYAKMDDRQLDWWMEEYTGDSALYANALKRDAHLIYDKNLGDSLSLAKIHNAPVYIYGGIRYDENDNPVYDSTAIQRVNPLHNMEVNYNNYKDRLRELYKMRSALMQRVNKR